MDEMEDEVEMGTVVIPLSNPTSNPPSHPPSNSTSEKLVPALVVPRPTGSIIMPGGTSARSGQKANSVKFELQPMVSQNTVSTTSLASTNIYHRDEEEKEYVSSKGSAKESRGIGAMVSFSRQPSYRESTIIDASSGKDTIRVMSAKQQMFEEQQSQQQLSATSTRQNSGGKLQFVFSFIVFSVRVHLLLRVDSFRTSSSVLNASFCFQNRCGRAVRPMRREIRPRATFPLPRQLSRVFSLQHAPQPPTTARFVSPQR